MNGAATHLSTPLCLGITAPPLLTRTSRRVALTEAGQRLLRHAGYAVDEALESLRTVSAKRGEVTGRVRLTAPAVAVDVLSQLLPKFFALHPKVEVEVRVEGRQRDLVFHARQH